MGGEWKLMSLREAGVELLDCVHKTPTARDEGFPYIAIPEMKGGRINFNDARRISSEDFDIWTKKAYPKAHDVILSRRCNPGETAHVPVDKTEFALGQNLVLLRSDNTFVHRHFLRWLVSGPEWWNNIRTFLNVGAVFDSLKCADIPNFRFSIPPLPEQHAIAEILGSLDDKIELNRRMNKTLEAMARAIFKAWFVDFEPVKAKAVGVTSFRGMPQEVFEKLPDRLVESELGMIPEGWEVQAVAQIANYINGKAFTKHADDHGRMIIRIAELNSGPGSATKYSDIEAEAEYTAFPDDILFAWSGSLGVYRWHRDEALINQHIFKVIPNNYPKWYVYYRLDEAMPFFKTIASTKATTMGHIKRSHLNDAVFAAPPKWLIDAANEQINDFYNLIHSNSSQVYALEMTRDSLLPRLISGEIRVAGTNDE